MGNTVSPTLPKHAETFGLLLDQPDGFADQDKKPAHLNGPSRAATLAASPIGSGNKAAVYCFAAGSAQRAHQLAAP